jgi:hypothetical protein
MRAHRQKAAVEAAFLADKDGFDRRRHIKLASFSTRTEVMFQGWLQKKKGPSY